MASGIEVDAERVAGGFARDERVDGATTNGEAHHPERSRRAKQEEEKKKKKKKTGRSFTGRED